VEEAQAELGLAVEARAEANVTEWQAARQQQQQLLRHLSQLAETQAALEREVASSHSQKVRALEYARPSSEERAPQLRWEGGAAQQGRVSEAARREWGSGGGTVSLNDEERWARAKEEHNQVHSKVNHLADMVEQMMDERFQRDKAITAELNAVQLKVVELERALASRAVGRGPPDQSAGPPAARDFAEAQSQLEMHVEAAMDAQWKAAMAEAQALVEAEAEGRRALEQRVLTQLELHEGELEELRRSQRHDAQVDALAAQVNSLREQLVEAVLPPAASRPGEEARRGDGRGEAPLQRVASSSLGLDADESDASSAPPAAARRKQPPAAAQSSAGDASSASTLASHTPVLRRWKSFKLGHSTALPALHEGAAMAKAPGGPPSPVAKSLKSIREEMGSRITLRMARDKLIDIHSGLSPLEELEDWLSLMDQQMRHALAEEHFLAKKQLEHTEAQSSLKDVVSVARQLEQRKRLQQRLFAARSRGEEVIHIVRVCLSYYFMGALQRRYHLLRNRLCFALLNWQRLALGHTQEIMQKLQLLEEADAAWLDEKPKPRWLKRHKETSTCPPALYQPEAVLDQRGTGPTKLLLVKWVGFSTPSWELESKMAEVKGFPELLRKSERAPSSTYLV